MSSSQRNATPPKGSVRTGLDPDLHTELFSLMRPQAPIEEQRGYEGPKTPPDLDDLNYEDLVAYNDHTEKDLDWQQEYDSDPDYDDVSEDVFGSTIFDAEAALEEDSDTPDILGASYPSKRRNFQEQL